MNKQAIQQWMQKRAAELLEQKEVDMVIGWEQGTLWWQAPPVLIRQAAEAEKLIFNDFCQSNLSKYLLDFRYLEGKVALFVKGCDARAFNRLLQDKQISRDKVYLIGIPCEGMKDHRIAQTKEQNSEDIPLAKICQNCRYPNPVVYDELIGEEVAVRQDVCDYSDVERMENLSEEERYTFWQNEYSKCIRCYACRNACPACNCRQCIFDQSASNWNSKDVNASENAFYGLTRAMHIAGRCIECGQCEYVCPSNIPIMLINKKLQKDIEQLFHEKDAGLDIDAPIALGHYSLDDPEEFM